MRLVDPYAQIASDVAQVRANNSFQADAAWRHRLNSGLGRPRPARVGRWADVDSHANRRRSYGPSGSVDLGEHYAQAHCFRFISLDGVIQSLPGLEKIQRRIPPWWLDGSLAEEAPPKIAGPALAAVSSCCWGVAPTTYRSVLAARTGPIQTAAPSLSC